MPTFFVLRCCSCAIFNVQQEVKSGKWVCKRCGAKQSVKTVFFRSADARECRAHVQGANCAAGPADEAAAARRAAAERAAEESLARGANPATGAGAKRSRDPEAGGGWGCGAAARGGGYADAEEA
jgi:hypothetical protein